MSLKDVVIRSVAAEEIEERRYKLAAAMLTGQETALLQEVYFYALDVAHGTAATEGQLAGARIVLESLGLVLLSRVEAMDEEIERLLDEVVDKELGDDAHEPLFYDRASGLSLFLEPDHDDEGDTRDLALDLQAASQSVYVSLRVVDAGATRLGGWLPIEDVPDLQRCLAIVAADAAAMRQDDDAPDEA
jgi:hypothetical protein